MSVESILNGVTEQISQLKEQMRELQAQQAPKLTSPGILFSNANGDFAQDAANFFYDDTTDTLNVPNLRAREVGYRHAQTLLQWAATVTLDASYNLKWSARLISLPAENNLLGPSYLQMDMPAAGVTITGYRGAANQVVTANGIPMAIWTALVAEHTLGSGTTTAITYKLVSYTGTQIEFPSNWIILAVRHGDTGVVMLAGAGSIFPGETFKNNRFVNFGASFPAIWPASAGSPWYHTTHGRWYTYNGTNWLSDYETLPLITIGTFPFQAAAIGTNTVLFQGALPFGQDIKGLAGQLNFYVFSTHSAGNFYTITTEHIQASTGTVTAVDSFSTWAVSGAGPGVADAQSINFTTTLPNTTGSLQFTYINIKATKTGAPGAMTLLPMLRYRFLGA